MTINTIDLHKTLAVFLLSFYAPMLDLRGDACRHHFPHFPHIGPGQPRGAGAGGTREER